jgi:predicted AAA+ superfamily ATPase
LPALSNEKVLDSDYTNKYIENVLQTVMEKDVIQRFKISDIRAFDNVLKFVYKNIGSSISPSSISNALKKEGKNISHKSIQKYLEMLTLCFLLYKVNRFDIKGKSQLATLEKYYVPDLGLRKMLIGQFSGSDIGHKLENIVYFELLRRGGKVWIGKYNGTEVDFILQKPNTEVEYYQVAYTAKEESTVQRELNPLKNIKDNYPKYLLTTDEFEYNDSGIKILNVQRWLLKFSN